MPLGHPVSLPPTEKPNTGLALATPRGVCLPLRAVLLKRRRLRGNVGFTVSPGECFRPLSPDREAIALLKWPTISGGAHAVKFD